MRGEGTMALRVIADATDDSDYERTFAKMRLRLGESELVRVNTVDQVKDLLQRPLEVLMLSAHGRVHVAGGVNQHEVRIGGVWHPASEFSDESRVQSPSIFVVDACDQKTDVAPGTAMDDWARALPNLACIFVGQGGVIPSLSIEMAAVAARMSDDPTFTVTRVGWPGHVPRSGYWFESTSAKACAGFTAVPRNTV